MPFFCARQRTQSVQNILQTTGLHTTPSVVLRVACKNKLGTGDSTVAVGSATPVACKTLSRKREAKLSLFAELRSQSVIFAWLV